MAKENQFAVPSNLVRSRTKLPRIGQFANRTPILSSAAKESQFIAVSY
jgi:hypothetical protein